MPAVIRKHQNNWYLRMNRYINSRVLEETRTQSLPNLAGASTKDGERFHLMMQQVGLGIPVDNLLATYPQLKKWVDTAFPYTQIPGSKRWNVDLSHEFNEVYLIENYDFIVSNDDKTIAVDWTISKPQDFDSLQESWKTQLRLFLLYENTGIKCEDISLVYLFVNSKVVYQCCYSSKQHEENKQKLNAIIAPVKSQVREDDALSKMHDDWLGGNINIQEYFNAIPEVEL